MKAAIVITSAYWCAAAFGGVLGWLCACAAGAAVAYFYERRGRRDAGATTRRVCRVRFVNR